MKREWTIPELIDRWSLAPAERALIDEGRTDHTRLGLAVLLKYFRLEWRFPRGRADVPAPAVAHLARQLGVPAACFLAYDWAGRTATQHRAALRAFLDVREATVEDQQGVADWLLAQVLPQTQQPEVLRAAFLDRCRALGLEPPTPERIERQLRAALAAHDDPLCAAVLGRLSPDARAGLDELLSVAPDPAGRSALADLKHDPGPLAVETAVPALRRFALGLQGDLEAVRAGLTEPWSTGPVEGQITKLKLLKRQGYGRAGFALLRQRMLRAAS